MYRTAAGIVAALAAAVSALQSLTSPRGRLRRRPRSLGARLDALPNVTRCSTKRFRLPTLPRNISVIGHSRPGRRALKVRTVIPPRPVPNRRGVGAMLVRRPSLPGDRARRPGMGVERALVIHGWLDEVRSMALHNACASVAAPGRDRTCPSRPTRAPAPRSHRGRSPADMRRG